MNGEQSAYAALGLRPGAGRAEVDEAYRRLIKRYHPDRTGGDCSRAAEINRAYTQIRRQFREPGRPPRSVPVRVNPPVRRTGRRRASWMLITTIVVLGALGVANDGTADSSSRRYAEPIRWPAQDYRPSVTVAAAPLANFEDPLQTVVIDRAIADAVKFHAAGDPAAALEFSRSCHIRLRNEPSLTWFDSCAAFDEAIVIVNGADPLGDPGPFNASSVMSRQMSAARLLSNDILAADSRINQIRSRVELALVPRLDEAAASTP